MVLGWEKMKAERTQQEMADEAEAMAGKGMLKKAAKDLSTRKTRARLDEAEDAALNPNKKPY